VFCLGDSVCAIVQAMYQSNITSHRTTKNSAFSYIAQRQDVEQRSALRCGSMLHRSTAHYRPVQHTTEQYSTLQNSTAHYTEVQHSTIPDTPTSFAAFSISSSLLASDVVVVHFWDVEETLGTFKCTMFTCSLITERRRRGEERRSGRDGGHRKVRGEL
jgi:hypothetical protein